MYKLINLPLEKQCIQRLSDNAFIPLAPDNTDYQEYLAWVAAGNQPIPAGQPE
jgi:hypothetical protein